MKIAVIGLGKIGLPLAVQYARKGHDVIGVDINKKTVDLINAGIEPFPEEAHLREFLIEVVESGKLRATLNYEEAISIAEAIVVVVPLFVNDEAQPDFVSMDKATKYIGMYLQKGSIVCFETTLPIGTTRHRLTPILEEESGMNVGVDFNVVFSPERVFTGRIFEDLRHYPKIVGGITKTCSQKGVLFYEKVLDFIDRTDLPKPNGVWNLESVESAEFVKLAETTYRDVNIALANQFTMHADALGINIYEIIEAANSQKFSHIHKPGISVGGHCIPVYPRFYLWNDGKASIVREARKTNEYMPHYVVKELENKIGILSGLKFLVLGISYRAGVKETAFSGVFPLVRNLEEKGGHVEVLDPLYSEHEIRSLGLSPYNKIPSQIDVIILHTDHSQFSELDFNKFSNLKYAYDGRNFFQWTNKDFSNKLISLGNRKGE